MHDSSKGHNNNLFKTDINLEKYIINLNSSLFYSMIRYRTANHKLPIETGRWNNTDLSERNCKLCTKNDLGDEYHYLLRCMRGSRKFCQRGSNFFFFFFLIRGKRIQIALKVGHHWPASETPFKWRFAGELMMVHHRMLAWQLCDFSGDKEQYC